MLNVVLELVLHVKVALRFISVAVERKLVNFRSNPVRQSGGPRRSRQLTNHSRLMVLCSHRVGCADLNGLVVDLVHGQSGRERCMQEFILRQRRHVLSKIRHRKFAPPRRSDASRQPGPSCSAPRAACEPVDE
ncbi:BZ3501_MvSof-1269-A2-R1_Chr11g02874 [Babesia caballi]|uniref:BZ3501_MvSof-1269-A2-R1_Chr11g02874 n=1 Tax=Babesia caballi TaxID=5871 RepID=A0AAV4LXH5_BABCB|nr:BZ3501_MvSof-1269-A2-R1_Chr11g02874 [Babesia caballi]